MRFSATRAARARIAMPVAILSCVVISSCALGFLPGRGGSVAISVRIPSSVGDSGLSPLARSLLGSSGANRFVNPDTRSIEAVVAARDGSFSKSASAQVSASDSTATLVLSGLPSGEYEATVTLFDALGVVLSRGSSAVTVNAGREAPALVYAVPVTELSMAPGPTGINIPDTDSGAIRVYRVVLPKGGNYALSYVLPMGLPSPEVAIYDGDGRRLPAESGAVAGYRAFTAQAGDCYAVVKVPALTDGQQMGLAVDADLRVTVDAKTVYVDPSLSVMDRMRPFSLKIACGFGTPGASVSVTPSIPSRSMAGTVRADGTAYFDTSVSGLDASDSAPVYTLDFIDPLLGISRSAGTAVAFTLPAAPRSFVYVGQAPTETGSLHYPTLEGACGAINSTSEAYTPAVILPAGTFSENFPVHILRPTAVIGGCSADWSRTAVHGTSRVELSSFFDGLTVGGAAGGSLLDSLALTSPPMDFSMSNLSGMNALVRIDADAVLRDCSILVPGAISYGSGAAIFQYGLVATQANLLFDRCSIVGGRYSITAADPASQLFGLMSHGGEWTVTLVNSIVYPGTIDRATTVSFSLCGIGGLKDTSASDSYSITLNAVGSTISGGDNASGRNIAQRAIGLNGNANTTFRVLNCFLLASSPFTTISTIGFLADASDSVVQHRLRRVLIGSTGIADVSVIDIAGIPVSGADWDGGDCQSYNSSPICAYDSLGLASLSPAAAEFLAPTAASPSALVGSGVDLSGGGGLADVGIPNTAIAGVNLTIDRNGKPRRGNGLTGYAIGAIEAD